MFEDIPVVTNIYIGYNYLSYSVKTADDSISQIIRDLPNLEGWLFYNIGWF